MTPRPVAAAPAEPAVAAVPGRDGTLLGALCEDLDTGFASLVRAHQDGLFSFALQLCGVRTDAEDLTAETFLRAYRVLGGYPRERILELRPRPWLTTILLNLWRNTLRDRGRRPRQVPLEHTPDVRSDSPPVEEVYELTELELELGAALRALTHAQRCAVFLRHAVGFSVAEIAEVLTCPEGTVKSHISRGLAKLRDVYPPAVPERTVREG